MKYVRICDTRKPLKIKTNMYYLIIFNYLKREEYGTN